MNRTSPLSFVMMFALLSLVCCRQSGEKADSSPADSANPKQAESVAIVRKQVPFAGDFSAITNVSDVNIVFTEGPCNVEIVGPEPLVNAIRVSFDSEVVTFSQLEDGKSNVFARGSGVDGATIYVSCPELRMLGVCSGGGFRSEGTIHTASLHVGTLSMAPIQMDTLIVDGTFLYETSDSGDAVFCYIRAGGDVTSYVSDNGELQMNVVTDGVFVVNAGARSVSHFDAVAQSAELLLVGQSQCDVSIKTDALTVEAFDRAMANIKCTKDLKHKDVRKGKNAQVNIETVAK